MLEVQKPKKKRVPKLTEIKPDIKINEINKVELTPEKKIASDFINAKPTENIQSLNFKGISYKANKNGVFQIEREVFNELKKHIQINES